MFVVLFSSSTYLLFSFVFFSIQADSLLRSCTPQSAPRILRDVYSQ
jgi:hypothetical protein